VVLSVSPSNRRAVALRLLTAFVIGFVSLTLEIAYTRVISFKLFYYYTYFVIGLALLGLGAASAFTALSDRLRTADSARLVQRTAPIAAALGVLGYVVVARLATNVNLIWTGSIAQAVKQLLLLLVLAISITAVFFAVGLLFATLVVNQAEQVRRLYFWDLTGAALGCLAAVPLEATVGPPAMILGALVALALLGLVMAALAGGTGSSRRVVGSVLAVLAVAGVAVAAGQLKVRTDDTKTLRDRDKVDGGGWGAVFRVDAVDLGDLKVLHHDGLFGSSIWRYDGTPATTDRFKTDNRQIPFAAVGVREPRVLIIGAAGGNEIMASLTYGAGHVDAVELNPVTAKLLRHTFADYSGHVVDDPRVHYVQGDGRTFLARSKDEYDIIWFVAPDSYAASNAATSGAFVLSESYLYTQEMIETAFSHLDPAGIMVAQFGDFAFDERANRTARYLTTAREALRGRVTNVKDHIGLLIEAADADVLKISTVMLSKSAIAPDRVDRIHEAVARLPKVTTKYLPGADRVEGVTSDIITSTDAEVAAMVAGYPLEIGPIKDDRPFFWHFTSFGTVLSERHRTFQDSDIAIGERLLVVLVGIASIVAALFLWLPFGVSRRRSRGSASSNEASPKVQGRARLFAYFAALGLGFMLIEVSMIQRFALLLGFPTLSLSVSLFTLLIATAIGARLSSVVKRLRFGLAAVTAALIVLSIVYVAIVRPLTTTALAWAQGARMALVVVLLFPIGLLLGMFLPTGIDRAVDAAGVDESVRGRLVAWCWAVNGFFSVIGSSVTTIFSMAFGFNRTLVAGLAMYVIATAVHGVQRVVAGDAVHNARPVTAAALSDAALPAT
jgi:spermidine synthase